MFATRIDSDLLKQVKHLSVDTEKPISTFIEEALAELFKKNEEKPTE